MVKCPKQQGIAQQGAGMNDSGSLETGDRSPTIQKLAATFSWMVFVLSTVLLLVFAWPEIRSELNSFIERVQPEEIRDIALSAYFLSWVVAMYVDVRIQGRVYQEDPSGGGLAFKGSIVALVLFFLAVTLIWSRTSELRLVIVLNLFFFTNVLAWLQTVRLVRPVINFVGRSF
jgi:hypothetical protein